MAVLSHQPFRISYYGVCHIEFIKAIDDLFFVQYKVSLQIHLLRTIKIIHLGVGDSGELASPFGWQPTENPILL